MPPISSSTARVAPRTAQSASTPALPDNKSKVTGSHTINAYEIDHNRDYSTFEWATIGPDAHPYRGIANPGGTGGAIAEAGKPLAITYSRPEYTYHVDPLSSAMEDAGGRNVDVDYATKELSYRINGGPIQTLKLQAGETVANVNLPANAKGDLEYWWKLTTQTGQTQWDSQSGRNYHVAILPKPDATIVFDKGFGETVDGQLKRGSSVRLDFDRQRLSNELVRQAKADQAQLGTSYDVNSGDIKITAMVSFDGKAPIELPLDQGFGVTYEPLVQVPDDAQSMRVWFKGTVRSTLPSDGYRPGVGGPVHDAWHDVYDSDFGKNYRFDVG